MLFVILLFFCPASSSSPSSSPSSPSFTVDWDNDRFLKDGQQFQFYSGGMHYFRVPRAYWRDRLSKMKLAGMNTLQTYLAWNSHQPQEDGNTVGLEDVTDYLALAQEMGLNVVLRPGPYICAEWEFGGLPYWLLNKPGIEFRVYNEPYVAAIADWFAVVLPKVAPFLYKNGGPIIAVQVENEYGAFGPHVCDHKYLQFILDQYKQYLGDDVVYYTVDNTNVVRLACGALPGLLKTLDFGSNKIPHFQFEMLRRFQAHGPLVNTEFWSGWFDEWGDRMHANVSASLVAERLDQMIALNASVNLYMFEGGTNFGYTSGAMSKDGYAYNARVTSYDYDSPLTEAGDTTPKYWAIRKVMQKYVTLPPGPVPPHSPKWSSGEIALNTVVPLLDNLDVFSKCRAGRLPVTMEQFNQSAGFILYQLEWDSGASTISLYNVHDRAAVFLDKVRVGTIDRREAANGTITLPQGRRGDKVTISILVENMGRANHGSFMGGEYKGITKMVLIDGVVVNSENWTICPLPIEQINEVQMSSARTPAAGYSFAPAFYCTTFPSPPSPQDTFLDPQGWGKGLAFLNNRNLGRYWPSVGPQVTLYTPGVFFNKGDNQFCMFEIDSAPETQSVKFVSKPILGK